MSDTVLSLASLGSVFLLFYSIALTHCFPSYLSSLASLRYLYTHSPPCLLALTTRARCLYMTAIGYWSDRRQRPHLHPFSWNTVNSAENADINAHVFSGWSAKMSDFNTDTSHVTRHTPYRIRYYSHSSSNSVINIHSEIVLLNLYPSSIFSPQTNQWRSRFNTLS